MRVIMLFFFSTGLLSFAFFGQRQNASSFKVYKIDSVKSFYLIYADRDKLKYKIVSEKRKDDCKNIKVGGSYAFNLHSMSYINGRPVTPEISKYEVSAIGVDDSTAINLDHETQWDLYYSENIKGLCFSN